jgi:hypothetical protein
MDSVTLAAFAKEAADMVKTDNVLNKASGIMGMLLS